MRLQKRGARALWEPSYIDVPTLANTCLTQRIQKGGAQMAKKRSAVLKRVNATREKYRAAHLEEFDSTGKWIGNKNAPTEAGAD